MNVVFRAIIITSTLVAIAAAQPVESPIVVDSIAAMKALNRGNLANRVVRVKGEQQDFIYDPAAVAPTAEGIVFMSDALPGGYVRQFSGALSLRWFGGRSDDTPLGSGGFDNESAIEALIAEAISRRVPAYLPPGVYRTGGEIDIPVTTAGFELFGHGADTIVKWGGTALGGEGVFRAGAGVTQKVVFRDFVISCNGGSLCDYAFTSDTDSTNSAFANFRFENLQLDGALISNVRIIRGWTGRFHKCIVTGAGTYNFELGGGTCNAMSITGSTVTKADIQILQRNGQTLLISDCGIENSGGAGSDPGAAIIANNVRGVRIENNHFEGNSGVGVNWIAPGPVLNTKHPIILNGNTSSANAHNVLSQASPCTDVVITGNLTNGLNELVYPYGVDRVHAYGNSYSAASNLSVFAFPPSIFSEMSEKNIAFRGPRLEVDDIIAVDRVSSPLGNGTDSGATVRDVGIVSYPFSLSAWIRPPASFSNDKFLQLRRRYPHVPGSDSYLGFGTSATGNLAIYRREAGGSPAQTNGVSTPFSTNTWHHVVVTFNSSTNVIGWVDGVEAFSNASMTAGVDPAGVVECLLGTNGNIHDVRVYDRGITATEAALLASKSRSNTEVPDYIGRWDTTGDNVLTEMTGSQNPIILAPGLVPDVGQAPFDLPHIHQATRESVLVASLDGASRIESLSPIAASAYPITMSCWFRSDVNNNRSIMRLGETSDYIEMGRSTSGAIRCLRRTTGGSLDVQESAVTDIDASVWHHMAVVFVSATEVQGYLDGRLIWNPTGMVAAKEPRETSGHIWLMNTHVGAVHDARVYDRALTANEVSTLANTRKAGGAVRDPVAWWDTGTAQAAKDVTGRSNVGIHIGTVTIGTSDVVHALLPTVAQDSGIPVRTTAQFASATDRVNVAGKYPGKLGYDVTLSRVVVASGVAPADGWVPLGTRKEGQDDITAAQTGTPTPTIELIEGSFDNDIMTVAENVTIGFDVAAAVPGYYGLTLVQDGTGGWTISLPTGTGFSGTPPTQPATTPGTSWNIHYYFDGTKIHYQ